MQSQSWYRNILKSARTLGKSLTMNTELELEATSFYAILSVIKSWGSAVLCQGPPFPQRFCGAGGKVRGRHRWPCGGQSSLCPVLFQLPCVAAAVAEPARACGAAAGLLRLGSDHRGRFSKAWFLLLAFSSALVSPHVTAVFSPLFQGFGMPMFWSLAKTFYKLGTLLFRARGLYTVIACMKTTFLMWYSLIFNQMIEVNPLV